MERGSRTVNTVALRTHPGYGVLSNPPTRHVMSCNWPFHVSRSLQVGVKGLCPGKLHCMWQVDGGGGELGGDDAVGFVGSLNCRDNGRALYVRECSTDTPLPKARRLQELADLGHKTAGTGVLLRASGYLIIPEVQAKGAVQWAGTMHSRPEWRAVEATREPRRRRLSKPQ